MFDFTPDIKISKKYRKWYSFGRLFLYGGFFLFGTFVFSKIVFPDHYDFFDFEQYYGKNNTVINPRLEDGENVLEKLSPNEKMIFNVVVRGDFDSLLWEIKTKNTTLLEGDLFVTRAYRAMLYPQGEKIGFREGSLLRYKERLFIILKGMIYEIDQNTREALSFDTNNFMEITQEEFSLYKEVSFLPSDTFWIEGSLFSTEDGEYYQVEGGALHSFVSENAYLASYRKEDARFLPKERVNIPREEQKKKGFPDGTLLSYKDGVFIVEEGFLRGVDTAETFLSKGYDWDMLFPVTEEEVSPYEISGLFSLRSPHVQGTVFSDKENNISYFVDKGKLREIVGEHIAKQYQSGGRVFVDFQVEKKTCSLSKVGKKKYECFLPLGSKEEGFEYEFTFVPKNETSLKEMGVTFSMKKNWDHTKLFLSDIKNRLGQRIGIVN
ncbi:MAG: hypothetical protein EOM19_01130 [Candidatus Moranbacteria bacterium]|nr:hypothetical protein [Candidatus Moranbacteria bacterium]